MIPATSIPVVRLWSTATVGLCMASLWGPMLWRLREAWDSDPELMHGWTVPLLAAYLWWQRARQPENKPALVMLRRHEVVGGTLLLVGLIGTWSMAPILEVNALWPRAQWAAGFWAVLGSVGLLYWSGGWPRVRHFLFPVLFLLTALAWPSAVRMPIVNSLTQWHAQLSAEVVSLMGYPAVVRGNLIEVASGLIGVEDACAGLRSLQAVWMFALFFGELHLMGWAGRLRVIMAAGFLALAGNVVRTVFLTWRVGVEGGSAAERWHDNAGLTVLLVTLVGVILYSLVETQFQRPRTTPVPVTRPWPTLWAPALAAIVVATMAAEFFVQDWYARDASVSVARRWSLQDNAHKWQRGEVHPETIGTLLCTSAEEIRTRDDSGVSALAAVFRWEKDRLATSTLTNAHDPTVCMPAIGGRLLGSPGETSLFVGSRVLVFDIYRFETAGQIQTVFNAVWDAMEGRSMPRAERGATMGSERMSRVWQGQRFADRDRVVMVLEGDYSVESAVDWLRRSAPEVLRPTVSPL